MIICSLEIENYKQYAGYHLIDFPEQGIVSVTGPNGAGKTTLFESIEWALYNPLSIPRNTIPPHDGVGKTVVRVTLMDQVEGVRYCVERTLRSGNTQAMVFREDNPGEPIVQGTKDVTRYVARHLIGLPHDAFVSTFFTRQKELHFFGDRSDTKRRTEVARLLGLEAVREAQSLIGEERTATRNEAALRRAEHESRIGTRDLLAEEAVAESTLAAARNQEDAAESAGVEAEQASQAARQEFERWRELQLQAAQMERRITAVSGEMSTVASRRDAASSDLARLEQRASDRMAHAAVASRLDEFMVAALAHEAERERSQQASRIRERQQAAETRIDGIVKRLAALVTEHHGLVSDIGWSWSEQDQSNPLEALSRLHTVVAAVDPRVNRARVAALQEVTRLGNERSKRAETLDKFQTRLRDLSEQRAVLVAGGGPEQLAEQARQSIELARQLEREARERSAALHVSRKEAERVIKELQEHAGDAACPVCARELSPGDADRLIAERRAEVASLRETEQALALQATNAQRDVKVGEEALQIAQTQLAKLADIDGRLVHGGELTEQALVALQEIDTMLTAAEHGCQATYPIEPLQLIAAADAAEHEERLASQAGVLTQLGRDLGEAQEGLERALEEAASLGEVRYDTVAHKQTNEDLGAARDAAAAIKQIDIDLAHRPEYQRRRAEAEAELADLDAQRAALQTELEGLGFDLARLQEAQARETAARSVEQQARAARTHARQAVHDAEAALKRLREEHGRLADLLEVADRKTREADELHRMYTEFGEFDQYVARQVGPMLAESTERLLSQVTNSKYSQIRFDENYGIHVYDGDEDFPLSSFSGGERDVVALCARLALSEIVGSAAARPPRFLVLDEVFASLDVERREQLLETLGVLANGGHFRQMFIISHVEDVQQSPVMNEAWTITERDGSSYVERPSFFGAPLAAD